MLSSSINRFVFVFSMFFAAASFASSSVTGNVEAFLITDQGSAKALDDAATAEPGDVIEYRLVFTNAGEEDVFGLNVVNPIPKHTAFVSQSENTRIPASFKVSIDGGETFESTPVKRIETQSDGTQKEVVVPPSQYTHVQWKADQPLTSEGGQHVYSYRVVIQ